MRQKADYKKAGGLLSEGKIGQGFDELDQLGWVREVADGLNVDLDAAGEVVGFDIDNASRRLDLTTL